MKRLFSMLLTLTTLAACYASPRVSQPDFAYPKTVSTNSINALDKALRAGNVNSSMRALIDYTIASRMIGDSNLPAVFNRIDSVRSVTDNEILRSLANLLEASIYSDVYISGKWNYDRRELPLTPVPADFNEWSGAQFRQHISQLLDSALLRSDSLRKKKLSDFKDIISQDSDTRIYYPTLYDFAANTAIRILTSISSGRSTLIPYSFVTRSLSSATSMPPLINDPASDRILSLYTSLISTSSPLSAPYVNAMLGRMEYMLDNSVNPITGNGVDRISAYMDLYRALCDVTGKPRSEYAGDILIATPMDSILYGHCTRFVDVYPDYWRINCIRNIISDLSVRSMSITSPSLVPIGKETILTVSMHNTMNGSVDIYDVSSLPVYSNQVDIKAGKDIPGKKIASIPVYATPAGFPFDEEETVRFAFPTSGNYIAVPVIDGIAAGNTSYTKIHASSVVITPSNFNSRTIWVMNPADGTPLDNVDISIVGNVYKSPVNIEKLGSTDKDGRLRTDSNSNGMVIATAGDDRYTLPVYSYGNRYRGSDKWVTNFEGYTSLPVYHPGDTAEWCAVCYEFKGGLRRVLAGKEMKAVLNDATSTPIDTITDVTDDFGRLTGRFIIPKEGLTGRYNIRIDGQWTSISFEVSDYKLPTFMIRTDNAMQGIPSDGDVTLQGQVITYSGFPLADTEVSLDLSVMSVPSWWRRSSVFKFYTASVLTDTNGRFSFPISKEILALSPLVHGYYSAQFTATSTTGETHTASISFTSGERYMIKVETPANIDISRGDVNLDVKVVDCRDSVINIPVKLSLYLDGKETKSMIVNNPVDLSGIRPGKYIMAYSLDRVGSADTVKTETVLYNPTSESTPVPGTLFWTPDSKVTLRGSTPGKLLYATDADSHLLLSATSGDSLIYTRWVKAPTGMHTLDISLPDSYDEATLNILCTGDYRQSSNLIKIVRDRMPDQIRFITETFRDKINPGSEETWTFRITSADGTGKSAAVIADLYNTALDAVARSSWSFHPSSGYTPTWSWGTMPLSLSSSNALRERIKDLDCQSIKNPQFETYGQSLSPNPLLGSGLKIRGTSGIRLMAKNEALSVATEYDGSVEVEESAAADLGTAMYDGSAEPTSSQSDADTFSYRESEVPLAFFRPSLTTDSNGSLSLTFTVPNANTTWGFRAIAFTDSLVSTTFSTTVLASKPVMVQPNLPRFLRTGDKAEVFASVMNNSDIEREIHTVVEIFNPTDGTTINRVENDDSICPGRSALIQVDIDVPENMTFIGYRVKSSSGDFADGEQALIPVLPSVTPVIETDPFFMGPDEHRFDMTLPSLPSGGRLTLNFCENPSWYVVTALPGLIDKEARTAPEAARSIYSAAVATGLLRDNPSIAEALRIWKESDRSAGILTSMLERNEDLKLLLLNATPWMTDADNDTERMTRLSLIFDRELVSKTLSANISTLKSLEASTGGWYWCNLYPVASTWATREVLSLMGRLSSLGFFPADKSLTDMISKALEWDNIETSKAFSARPDGDYTSYVRVHDMLSTATSVAPVSGIVEKTVQRILLGWKEAGLYRKAIYADILFRHNYPSVAREILNSIRQFAQESPSKGMWFPALDGDMNRIGITADILMCFHSVDPGCSEIDKLRQWLILQKGSQNWGDGTVASSAVAAILSTSGHWFVPASGTRISIDGENVVTTPSDEMLGEIETTIPESAHGKTLSIVREGDSPSWGAVFSYYTGQMTEIEAASCPELSIRKSLYQIANSDTGNIATSTDRYTLGSKVRVTLTIKADMDMDYVTVIDERPACFEPVEQLPGPIYAEGLCFYRENRDSDTRLFIDRLPKGTYILSYDMWVNNRGTYVSGIASIQSQYAPQFSAHSSGSLIDVE